MIKVATYNVRSLSVKGANGYDGLDEVVLHDAAAKNIAVLGIQETRRPGRTASTAAGYRVFYSDSENKRAFWHRLDSMVQRIPKNECLFVLMDANVRTGEKIEGERTEDNGVLGAYGRDELNDNGKGLLNFATDNKLAVTNTFFSTRKGDILRTYDGVIGDRAGDFKRIDYILTRQAHRPRVHNVEVNPQPNRPIKADSDHNMAFATHCGSWGTIRPQPPRTADTATLAIRQ